MERGLSGIVALHMIGLSCYIDITYYVKKIRSYIAQYPVLGTAQSALHFTPWQTC